IKLYTHLSDQYGPYHSTTISATASEAPYLVDGLLYHETDLEIAEHYSDTGAFTDQIFGICQLLGFRYAPRIRDLADSRAVCFHRRGLLQDRTFDDQRLRAGGLNLVVAAIVLWNTVYLERAVAALRASGTDVPDE